MADFVIFTTNGRVHYGIEYLGGERMERGLDRERRRILLSPCEETFGLDGLAHVFADEIADVQAELRKELGQ